MNSKTTKINKEQFDVEVVCNRIKKLLKQKGLTYESFANKYFNKTEGWFSHIMNKKRRFTVDVLLEIAEKLDIDPASLLPGKNSPKTLDEYIDQRIENQIKNIEDKINKIEKILKAK